MFTYFIIFTIVGFAIGRIMIEKEKSFAVMIIIAIIWAFTYNLFWGLVVFGELTLGYFISEINK
jgi:hypothetical protein